MGVGLLVLESAFAGGKLGGLDHPSLSIDAARKRQIGCDPPNLAPAPGGDLIEVKDAKSVEMIFIDRTHALDPLQVVRTTRARGFERQGSNADRVRLLLGCRVNRQAGERSLDVRRLRRRVRMRSSRFGRSWPLIVRRRWHNRCATAVGAVEARE